MNQSDTMVNKERFQDLPSLSVSEAAWMAGVTLETYERFMTVAGVEDMRAVRPDVLIRTAFTLLGQKESQLVMLRLQLAATLQREKELAEALGSRLSHHDPLPMAYVEPSVEKERKHAEPSVEEEVEEYAEPSVEEEMTYAEPSVEEKSKVKKEKKKKKKKKML